MIPPWQAFPWARLELAGMLRFSQPTFDVQEECNNRELETDHYKSLHVLHRDGGSDLPPNRINSVYKENQVVALRFAVRNFTHQLCLPQSS